MAGVEQNITTPTSGKKPPDKNTLIGQVLSVDLNPTLNDTRVSDQVKSLMAHSQNLVKTLNDENKVLENKLSAVSGENKVLENKLSAVTSKLISQDEIIASLQTQINEVKQQKTGNSQPTPKDINPKFVKEVTKSSKPSGQSKITQFTKDGSKNPSSSSSNQTADTKLIATSNKFVTLQHEDMEIATLEDDDAPADDASLSEDANSDPEFRAKRLIYRQQRKKRKRGNSSPQDETSKENNSKEPKDKLNNNSNTKSSVKVTKILPPPPIKVVGIKSFEEIKSLLKEASPEEEFTIRFLNNETWKVNPSSDEAYRKISEKLKVNNTQWYSHSNKNTRNIKVLCKGLPPSISEEEIVEDLQAKNFKIKSAVCLRKRVEKETQKNKNKNPENTQADQISNPPPLLLKRKLRSMS